MFNVKTRHLMTFILMMTLPAGYLPGAPEPPPVETNTRNDLLSLPYLRGYNPAPAEQGVIINDRTRAQPGINLYVSGGRPPVILMGMGGKVLHSWNIDPEDLGVRDPLFRRARLFPNGDLLVMIDMQGMLLLDKDSSIVWFSRQLCHHDFDLAENGDIYVVTRKLKQKNLEGPVNLPVESPEIIQLTSLDRNIDLPDMDIQGWIFDDCITIFGPGGEKKKDISIFECFVESEHRPMLQYMSLQNFQRDVFHTNTIELIDGPLSDLSKPFQKGYALISLRNMHLITLVDLIEEKVVWALTGMWVHQHHPELLPNGNILIFDNLGEKGYSKVVEFNPFTQEVVWAYRGNKDNGFRTEDLGAQQRLPNGNTLITESRDGRVFEVTTDNEIVWEFITPQRTGKDNELIAAVYDMTRLDPEEFYFLVQRDSTVTGP